ncbi:Crp/Fnr family transcriptional regulator [Chondrinema litorale]|uniref:Crp/Fnr family transcriptional regulator n=1 Tax=Chondrinema litorale TaxID=2994555 RepID=UPI002542823A|nr:Crp/Fnr family transcriptional regulator [Chondrinema litorale]UZR98116.1 Crp/Fnr family transcriptional regulator [Chondrinema litorale]
MKMLETLSLLSSLSKESQEQLVDLITEHQYSKGHVLLNLWQIDREVHFIVKGSGRVYYLRNGQDITDYIAMDGQILGGVESLFTQTPSNKAMELTEDSIVQSLNYQAFLKLCKKYRDLETLRAEIAIFAFLECQKRIESIRFLSASERYQELEKKYPGISNRIPLKHLASYLGTTQVSLSRIRSGIQ